MFKNMFTFAVKIIYKMNIRPIIINTLFVATTVVVLSSCLGNDNTGYNYTPSDNAKFSSLTFTANKKYPNQELAVFTLKYDSVQIGSQVFRETMIVNIDSLPLGTRVDSVITNFKFQDLSFAAYVIYNPYQNDSTKVLLDGTDTINFSKPIVVENIATDEVTKARYWIKVNVHKVNPDLYNWNKMSENIDNQHLDNQTAFLFNNVAFYYLNKNSNTALYNSSSADYKNWTAQTISGFPALAELRTMQIFNNKLFFLSEISLHNNKTYYEEDLHHLLHCIYIIKMS
jgi:hypothetical protein